MKNQKPSSKNRRRRKIPISAEKKKPKSDPTTLEPSETQAGDENSADIVESILDRMPFPASAEVNLTTGDFASDDTSTKKTAIRLKRGQQARKREFLQALNVAERSIPRKRYIRKFNQYSEQTRDKLLKIAIKYLSVSNAVAQVNSTLAVILDDAETQVDINMVMGLATKLTRIASMKVLLDEFYVSESKDYILKAFIDTQFQSQSSNAATLKRPGITAAPNREKTIGDDLYGKTKK
jgi:hypothetical protein